jgi:hypothetical protein
LFLAFLRLFEYARTQGNTLTARHSGFLLPGDTPFQGKTGGTCKRPSVGGTGQAGGVTPD